jgi:aerobic C4-dicarboxylate transport protein
VVPEVPVAGMALILGVDRFMSECRSLTNFIGNAVATVVVSKWENALDYEKLDAALAGKEENEAVSAHAERAQAQSKSPDLMVGAFSWISGFKPSRGRR